jgi:hypothetical protein
MHLCYVELIEIDRKMHQSIQTLYFSEWCSNGKSKSGFNVSTLSILSFDKFFKDNA